MVKTSTRIVGALALVGALMSNGPVSAAQPDAVMEGDLNQPRTSADVVIPVECAASTTTTITTATLSVKIFQSVGRLINIGTGSGVPICNGQATNDVTVKVDAIKGLKFQPGPATILITLTETVTTQTTDNSVQPPVVTETVVVTPTETGARINLKP